MKVGDSQIISHDKRSLWLGLSTIEVPKQEIIHLEGHGRNWSCGLSRMRVQRVRGSEGQRVRGQLGSSHQVEYRRQRTVDLNRPATKQVSASVLTINSYLTGPMMDVVNETQACPVDMMIARGLDRRGLFLELAQTLGAETEFET